MPSEVNQTQEKEQSDSFAPNENAEELEIDGDSVDPDNIVEELKIEDEALDNDIEALLNQLPAELLAKSLVERNAHHELENEGGMLGVMMQSMTQQSYSGPLPPPSMLQDYDHIQQGFADRIMAMAEKEQNHRHSRETQGITGAISKDARGQHYALICSLVLIVACTFLIASDHEVAGSILGGGTLVGLAYVFITGRKLKQKNRADKNREEKE